MSVPVSVEGERPPSDPVFGIETNGINYIPNEERHGSPVDLFWVWCAANIGLLGIIYGVIVVTYGLNLWQSILAGVLGTWLSFILVGFISDAGVRGGAPTLVLSRATFGIFGNVLPNIISYLSLLGWEVVLVALSTLAVEALFQRLGLPTGNGLRVIAFLVIAALVILIGLLGHATIIRVQTWFTWAFAVLTVIFFILDLPQLNVSKLASAPTGDWLNGFIPAVSIIAAGLGIGWVNAAADYSRYLPRSASTRSVVWWTTFGASIAPTLLIIFGILLAGKSTALASSANPIGDLARPLPTWFLVPYLITAVGGLVAGADLDIYSSGLNLLTLGVKLERYKTVVIDGVVMILGNIYFLFIAKDFLSPFQAFLVVLGIPLAAWSAVFLVDYAMFRRRGYVEPDLYRARGGVYRYLGGVNIRALVSWLVAVVVGFGLYKPYTPISWLNWMGWWDHGPFAGSSLGILAAFVVAGALYFVLSLPAWRQGMAPSAGVPGGQTAMGR